MKNNLKFLLECWYLELQILWQDLLQFRLRCLIDYKTFKIENQKDKLRAKGFSEEEINSIK